jgi:hypothetical protein
MRPALKPPDERKGRERPRSPVRDLSLALRPRCPPPLLVRGPRRRRAAARGCPDSRTDPMDAQDVRRVDLDVSLVRDFSFQPGCTTGRLVIVRVSPSPGSWCELRDRKGRRRDACISDGLVCWLRSP